MKVKRAWASSRRNTCRTNDLVNRTTAASDDIESEYEDWGMSITCTDASQSWMLTRIVQALRNVAFTTGRSEHRSSDRRNSRLSNQMNIILHKPQCLLPGLVVSPKTSNAILPVSSSRKQNRKVVLKHSGSQVSYHDQWWWQSKEHRCCSRTDRCDRQVFYSRQSGE